MENVSVTLPIEMISEMVANKMDNDRGFAKFVVEVLKDNYALDVVVDALSNGIPVSQFTIGTKLTTTERYWSTKKQAYFTIGACTLTGFNPYAKYGKYEIEFLSDAEDEAQETLKQTVNFDTLTLAS